MRRHLALGLVLLAQPPLIASGQQRDDSVPCRLERYLATHPEGLAVPGEEPRAALGATPCQDGSAGGFPCSKVDLLAHLPLSQIGGGQGSGSWGWTDPLTSDEYALIGRSNGTAFVRLDEASSVYLGNLPSHFGSSSWREIKTYQTYAYIVADNIGSHGMQVFDLTQLRDVVNPPVTFSETNHYDDFQEAHDLIVNEATGFLYAVGGETCSGDLHVVDLSDPANPANAGCIEMPNGSTHDLQCVVYQGPDVAHQGREICFLANNTTQSPLLTIVDVTDKANPQTLTSFAYPDAGFSHQGWLTEDHRYVIHDDELDELDFLHNTKTRVFDVSDLDDPTIAGFTLGPTPAIDHNQYVVGEFTYQANYRAGLRVLHFDDLTTGSLSEVAFFDTFPADDDADFLGAWSNYPFFASGTVSVGDMVGGIFVLRPRLDEIFGDGFESGNTGAWDQTVP
jgi:choice-of-anchor B domain-containing protein